MSGQTPVERAAKAIADPGVRGMCDKGCECEVDLVLTRWVARRALEAATRDVDELARVLHDAACVCDRTTHPAESWVNWTNSARAVVAHLTKGDENDE